MQTINIATPSENVILSQNGTAQNQAEESSSKLDKLLKANTPLAVWLIFLGIGGGLLALYYIRIGYLPEMEWNAALVYLFVCSIFGGVIGLVLTMSLYLPGVIWCDIIIFERTLDNHLTYYAEHDEPSGRQTRRKEPCIKSIVYYLGLPFLVVLVISHWCLQYDFYWAFAALILVATFVGMQLLFRWRLKPLDQTTTKQIIKYSSWFTLSVFLNQISMYVIYILANRTSVGKDFLVLTAMCTTSVWISAHVVAVRHRYSQWQALVFALVAAVVLLATADRFNNLSMKLMNRYGIGDSKKFNLLVKPDLVPLLKSEGVHTCGQQHVCNVEILSKMGDHYFVRVDHEVDMKVDGRVDIMLPKTDVIAIRRLN
jgi:hypothetical protein